MAVTRCLFLFLFLFLFLLYCQSKPKSLWQRLLSGRRIRNSTNKRVHSNIFDYAKSSFEYVKYSQDFCLQLLQGLASLLLIRNNLKLLPVGVPYRFSIEGVLFDMFPMIQSFRKPQNFLVGLLEFVIDTLQLFRQVVNFPVDFEKLL